MAASTTQRRVLPVPGEIPGVSFIASCSSRPRAPRPPPACACPRPTPTHTLDVTLGRHGRRRPAGRHHPGSHTALAVARRPRPTATGDPDLPRCPTTSPGRRTHAVGMKTIPMTAASRAAGLTKIYGAGEAAVWALDGVTAEFPRGRFTAIMGPSGSGKSTLMHCLAGLDRPTEGQVFLGGLDLGPLSDTQLTVLRRERVGFIFQSFNLLPALTVAENITLPLLLAGRRPDRSWLEEVVRTTGLGDRLSH